MYEIILLRHGQSIGNQNGLHQGLADFELSEEGKAQSRALANRWLSEGRCFDAIIYSPLKRARQTAEILAAALNTPLEPDSLWVEYDIGRHTGLAPEEAQQRFPHPEFMTPYDRVGETGESRWEAYLRAGRAASSLLSRPPGSYLVVSHGGFLNLVMYAILGLVPHANFQGPRFPLRNTAFIHLQYRPDENKWRLLGTNVRNHWPEEDDWEEPASSTTRKKPAAIEKPVKGKPEFTIRQAKQSDLRALCEIQVAIQALHAQALPDVFRPIQPEQVEGYLATFFSQPVPGLFVAEHEGTIVGAVGAFLREAPDLPIFQPRRYAIVDFVGVHPSHRRQGIGQTLMETIETWAHENGAEWVELNVWEFNRGALRLYEKLAYSTASRKLWKKLP